MKSNWRILVLGWHGNVTADNLALWFFYKCDALFKLDYHIVVGGLNVMINNFQVDKKAIFLTLNNDTQLELFTHAK